MRPLWLKTKEEENKSVSRRGREIPIYHTHTMCQAHCYIDDPLNKSLSVYWINEWKPVY